jgi:hypothetical protein
MLSRWCVETAAKGVSVVVVQDKKRISRRNICKTGAFPCNSISFSGIESIVVVHIHVSMSTINKHHIDILSHALAKITTH